MFKIITQKAEENKHISERIKNFMKRFDVFSALKSSNALTLWKKVCKNRKNCGKIEITQEDEILWEEENENQWARARGTS